MFNLNVLEDGSEVVRYNDPGVPIYVKDAKLFQFTGRGALCHWHDDIEYVRPLNGHITYYVNDEKILIREGDGLLINTRQMHRGVSEDGTDAFFYCVVFKPGVIFANQILYEKYAAPVLENTGLACSLLRQDVPDERRILETFDQIYGLYKRKEPGYELDACGLLLTAWKGWFGGLDWDCAGIDPAALEQIQIQKKMVLYIYENYTAPLSLEDIARAGNVCKNRCCQIFRKYLHKSPMQFLNACRLERSMELLSHSQMRVGEIAYACGFNSSSYFAEIFRQYKGCSPAAYRKNARASLEEGGR